MPFLSMIGRRYGRTEEVAAPAPAPGPAPPTPGTQLLLNYHFSNFNPSSGAASNWTTTNWNTYDNSKSNFPTVGSYVACINPLYFTRSGFQPLIYGSNTGFLIYSWNQNTVYQDVTISGLAGINNITCEIMARALEDPSSTLQSRPDQLTFKVDYYNSANSIITTTSCNLNTVLNSNFGTYQTILNRNSFLGFDNITKARVSIIGKDGGGWRGPYGPIVDYCSLTVN